MKHYCTKMFVLLIILTGLLPMNVQAKSCSHNYTNDICKKCGYVRVHEFQESITFYTIKDDVPIWSLPTKNSDLVKEVSNCDQAIEINGIIRNQYGNIWLRTGDMDGYVYIENLYLNFDVLAIQNYQYIIAYDDAEMGMLEFYDLVKPGGTADYKHWLDPSNKGIEYTVNFNDRCCKMTAEELGNIHYGFLGRLTGFPSEILLYAGGVVNQAGKLDFEALKKRTTEAAVKCANPDIVAFSICVITTETQDIITEIFNECSGSYCDNPDDAYNVQKGINYFETGILE